MQASGWSAEDCGEHLQVDVGRRSVSFGATSKVVNHDTRAEAALTGWLYVHLHAGNHSALDPAAAFGEAALKSRLIDALEKGAKGTYDAAVALDERGSPGYFRFFPQTWYPTWRSGLKPVIRYYIGLTNAQDAVRLMPRVISGLLDVEVPTYTKCLSSSDGYPRREAVVVYAGASDERVLSSLQEAVRLSDGVRPVVGSVLCRKLSMGIYAADEPRDRRPVRREQGFGEHRCGLIARAITQAIDGRGDFPRLLAAELAEGNVSVEDLSFNKTGGSSECQEGDRVPRRPAGR